MPRQPSIRSLQTNRKQSPLFRERHESRLSSGEKAGDIPQQILLNWNVWEEKVLFVHLCISLIAYSSYYNPAAYEKLYLNWFELGGTLNAEPHLRLGLLLALVAKRQAKPLPQFSLKALRHADTMMESERSATALVLAERDLTELSLPYDGGRIYVYPDLCNVTTYVLLEQGDWFEHDDLALFRSLIRPGNKVLDLGANVGVYAVSAALRTGSQGRVVAVEPAKETFELLNKSASAFEHMTAVRAAVSDKSGTGSLLPGRTPEDNKLSADQEQGEKVDVFSVDDLAAKHGIDCFDIIKMDVEGHEQLTLAGAQKIIGENSPIIFYEIKEGCDFHTELIDVFEKLGYDSYYYIGSTSTLVKFRKGQELDAYLLNMVAVRPESLHRFDGLVHIADVPSEQPGPDVRRSGTGKAVHSSASIQAAPSQSEQKNQKYAMEKPSIRILHNLARSGGTLVSKCLGCMKGTVLLSEIHPLGTHIWNPIPQAREWHNLLTPEDIRYFNARKRVDFIDVIRLIEARCAGTGQKLIIRDWAYLDFMGVPFLEEPGYRMLLVEELAPAFKFIQFGFVRHPIDQWLSLLKLRAIRENLSLEAFLRGCFLFAEEVAGIGYIRYEDLTRQPTEQMKILCEKLQLDFDKDFLSKWADYTFISGNIEKGKSRGGELREIVSLPRFPLEPDLLRQFRENTDYWNILELLGYSDVQEGESSVTYSSSASADNRPAGPVTKAKAKPAKRKINATRIFISSMPRSGSMWTHNVTRSLIRAAGLEPVPKNIPINDKPFVKKAFNEPVGENQVFCVKTHQIVDPKLPDTLIIVTYRDIRDAIFSYMKFMGLSFEDTFPVPKHWMVVTDRYSESQSPNILKIRYDEVVNEPMDTIQKIDRFIGTDVSFETIETINEQFSRKKMKEKVDGLKDISPEQARVNAAAFDTVKNAGSIVRVLDRATGFQTGHVSFRKDGQWREELTEEQKQHLMNETADWLQRHGFKV
jgi:FkbM family methyltransferase